MDFHVLTLFPEMIKQGLMTSITGRAIRQETISLQTVNIRDFSDDKHRRVDDYTYGGGAGMLMRTQPVFDAWSSVREGIPADHKRVRTIYVTPQGYPFNQRMAEDFSKADDLIFICGHYEGIDERVLEETVTDYVSIGDYVLTGGELAAMVMIDAISRLVPGVLHNEVSAETESFHGSLLEYPQYSRPEEWHGKKVPEVLLSGNQKEIDKWRLEQSLKRTRERRPDLYREYSRIQEARSILMKNKLQNAPAISLIDRGQAEILSIIDKSVILRSLCTGNLYLSETERHPEAELQLQKEAESAIAGKTSGRRIKCITNHELGQPCDLLTETGEYVPWVLTRREKLPVTGLYRPDGKPTSGGVTVRKPEGAKIHVNAEEDPELRKMQEIINRGEPVWIAGVNEEPAGIISMTADGCITELYVRESFRRRHIALALETCLCNYMLENGYLPYTLIRAEDQIMASIQTKLGLYPAKGMLTVYESIR